MNPDTIQSIALWLGYISLSFIAVFALVGGYIIAYKLIDIAGSKLFFPIWAWEIIKLIAIFRASRGGDKDMYVRYILIAMSELERKRPELRGMLDEVVGDRYNEAVANGRIKANDQK